MIIVQVYVKVNEKDIPDFITATLENAKKSIKEEGVIRFDFMQDRSEKQKFLLTEIYKDENAPLEHKKTKHYLRWRATVENMMAQPRKSEKYQEIYPKDEYMWKVSNA